MLKKKGPSTEVILLQGFRFLLTGPFIEINKISVTISINKY